MNRGQSVGDHIVVFIICGLLHIQGTDSQTLTQGTGCRESWIRNSNTHATGGTKFAAVNVEDQCFATCIARSNCVAIELNTNFYPAECWIFTDPNPLQSSVFQSGYNQYVLQTRCPQGQQPVCRDRWELLTASKSRGSGTFVSNVDTEEQCLNTCLLNIRCLAVDVKTSVRPIECYIQTNQSAIANPLYTEEYRLYLLLSRCDNTSSSASTVIGGGSSSVTTLPNTVPDVTQCWNVFPTQNSINGIQQNLFDLLSCRNYCVSVPACVAIDFDTSSNPPCWIHTNINDLLPDNIYNDNPSATQHQINRSGSCTAVSASSSSSATGSTLSSASASQTSGPQTVCWNVFPTQYSINGVPQNLFDVLSCRNYCVSVPACVAIDFDTSANPPCWIHTSTSDLQQNNIYYDNPAATQHQINRSGTCTSISSVSSSSAGSSVSTASTSQPSGPTSVCWNVFPTQYSVFGVPQNLFDVLSCRNYCVSVPACVAIDFDTSATPPCWIHTSTSDLQQNNIYNDNPAATQHQINRSGTCTSISSVSSSSAGSTVSTASTSQTSGTTTVCWNVFTTQYSINGVPQNLPDVLSCRNFCVSVPSCVAVDFDTSSTPRCWVHTDINDLQQSRTYFDNPFVNQHQINRGGTCTSGSSSASSAGPTGPSASTTLGPSTVCWNVFPTQYSVFGVPQNFFDVLSCRNYCVSVPACVAIDFDTSANPPCWIHTSTSDLQQNNIYNDNPSATQHQINRSGSCNPVSASSSSAGSTVSTASPTASNSVTTSQTQGPSTACWNVFPTQYSIRGVPQNLLDVLSCRNYCISLPACVAIDFDTSARPPCWIHTSNDDLTPINTYNDNPSATQHQINRAGSCTPGSVATQPSTSSASTACMAWIAKSNLQSEGAEAADFNTVADCQNYCISLPQCVAIDFDTSSDPPCWIHSDSNDLSVVIENTAVTQYQLNRACLGIVTQRSSTTGPSSSISGPTFSSISVVSDCLRWTILPEVNSVNGVQVPYNNIYTCLAYCDSVASCLAVDFDPTTSPPCWIHRNSDDITFNNTYYSPTASQYRLNRGCSGTLGTDVSTSPTSATTLSTGSTAVLPCAPRWVRYDDRLSLNAAHYLGFNTVDDCLNFCLSLPDCVAFDFDSTSSDNAGCWLHMSAIDLLPSNTYNPSYAVAQYIVDRSCPTVTTLPPDCKTQWSFRNNTSSGGGLHYFQYRTVETCQQLCVSLPVCVAVDFNTDLSLTSGGCYVHASTGELDNQYDAVGVQQYRIIGNCGTFTGPGDCVYIWSQPFYEQNIGGGVPTRYGTFGECQELCVRVPTCLGIDIDNSPNRYAYCWLQVMPGQLSPYPGVTHYQLTRGPTCPEVNTSPTPTDTTVSTATGVTGAYGVCPYYREMANSNANGGTSRGSMPIEQCLSMCIAQYPYCVAIDYRTVDSRCYHQNSVAGRQWNSCCTRYELVCQTSNCTDTFALFQNLVPSLRGFPQPTITTRVACEAACLSNSSCYGYSLARPPRYQGYDCLLSFNTIGSTDFAAENDLYVRQFCRMTVPPTASVTPPPTPPAGYCLLDIVFVVDVSGSIIENQPPGVNNLEFIRMFLRRLIQDPIQVGPYFDHVGIVKFESSAYVMYDLCNTQNIEAINVTGINGLPQPSGETNTPAGLRYAYNMLFSSTGCGRRYARPVVVLITDGVTTTDFRGDLFDSISALKSSGTTNVAVGVTDEINMQDLATFATNGDDVGVVTTFQELLYEQARVINRLVGLCGRSSIPTITRPSTTQTSPTSTATSTSTSTSTASTSTSTSTTTRSSTSSIQSTLTTSTSSSTTTATPSSTSTTTTTTAPSSSSTTTIATQPSTSTATLPPAVARPTAFSAGRSGNLNGPTNPVPLDAVLSNVNGAYNNVSYSYTTPSVGIYFVEICAGLQAGLPAAVALLQGGSTTLLGLVWQSRIHDGVETVCRSGLLQLLPSITLTLSLESGSLYSSSSLETMFSVFSVSDAMTDDARLRTLSAVGNSTSGGQTGILPLSATIGGSSSGVFDASTSSYTCTSSGLYFFSVTVASFAFDATRLDLTGLSRTIELTRNSELLNGITTLSRSVLLPCPAQSRVRLNITFGSITNYAAYQAISFSAFPYLPRSVSSTAWSLLKDYSSDTQSGPMDPFYFNIIAYNDNGLYDSDSRQVTIRTSGYYYVYISTGTATNRPLRFSLRRNGATLIVINHQSRNADAEDSGGHGAVVALYANDVLKVVGEVESSSYSSDLGYQVSFFGMLIYGL